MAMMEADFLKALQGEIGFHVFCLVIAEIRNNVCEVAEQLFSG